MKKQKRHVGRTVKSSGRITWRHWSIVGLLMAVLLVYGFAVSAMDGWWLRRTQIAQVDRTPSGMITIQGKVVCLPHRDQSGPQTTECALGVKDRGGYYYAVRSDAMQLTTGEDAQITGKPIPAKGDEPYDIIGTVVPKQ